MYCIYRHIYIHVTYILYIRLNCNFPKLAFAKIILLMSLLIIKRAPRGKLVPVHI